MSHFRRSMKMTPELARSKAIWRDMFALGALSDADRFLTLIEETGQSTPEPLKWPLWIAFIVSYAKPFTSNDDMGGISDKAIPSDLKQLHRSFRKARDSLYGHSNPLETLEDGFQANQIFVRKQGDECEIIPYTLVPLDEEIPRARRLVKALLEDLHKRTKDGKKHLCTQLSAKPDGDYLIPYPNLEEKTIEQMRQTSASQLPSQASDAQ